jgi:heptosyltransferase-1
VVDKNLDLAVAAGATTLLRTFPLPAGRPEGALPPGDFVLASPLAGWRAKQWPIEHYQALATLLDRELGIPLVLDGPPGSGLDHCSGLPGLIHATRCAAAVVGVDSGPLHLAAALGKPGVAIYGPTDPARNGPYGGSLRVLRSPAAVTTYKRGASIDESMRAVSPDHVFEALKGMLGERRSPV